MNDTSGERIHIGTHDELVARHEGNNDWCALIRLWLSLSAQNSHAMERAIRIVRNLRFEGFNILLEYLEYFAAHPRDARAKPSVLLLSLLDKVSILTLDVCTFYANYTEGFHIGDHPSDDQPTQANISLRAGFSARSAAARLQDGMLFAAISRPLSTALAFIGEHEKSVEMAEDSVQICRNNSQHGVEIHEIQLARSLDVLSNLIPDPVRSLELAMESISHYRSAGGIAPDRHREETGNALHETGARLFGSGEYFKALELQTEACRCYRALHQADPDKYSSPFSSVLRNLSITLENLGRPQEALCLIDECISLRSELVLTEGKRFTQLLAESHRTRSIILNQRGLFCQAADSAKLGVDLIGGLMMDDGRECRTNYAEHLTNYSRQLRKISSFRDALRTARDSLLCVQSAIRDNIPVDPIALAECLEHLSNCLADTGRFDDAVAVGRKAVESAKKAYSENSKKNEVSLACILSSFAGKLSNVDLSQAIMESGKGLALLRAAVARNPSNKGKLAGFLCNHSYYVLNSEDPDDSQRFAKEAVDLLQDADLPERDHLLAIAFEALSDSLDHLGKTSEAMDALELSVDIHRSLLSCHPESSRRRLANGLYKMSILLESLKRKPEAAGLLAESLDLWDVASESDQKLFIMERAFADLKYGKLSFDRYADIDHKRQALDHLRRSVALAELSRDVIGKSGSLKLIHFRYLDCYESLIIACLAAYGIDKDNSLLVEVTETVEKLRARQLLTQIENVPIPDRPQLELILEFRKVRDELLTLSRHGGASARGPDTHSALDLATRLGPRSSKKAGNDQEELNAKTEYLGRQLADIQKAIEAANPHWQPEATSPPASFEEIVSSIPTDKRTVFVTFVMLRHETVATIVSDSGAIDFVRLKDMTAEASRTLHVRWQKYYLGINERDARLFNRQSFMDHLRQGGMADWENSDHLWTFDEWKTFLPELLQVLSVNLISPLWSHLKSFADKSSGEAIERIIFMPHGPLQLYPLHACEADKGIPLEELVEVSYIPSGSILARIGRTTAANSGRTLLFGDPSGDLPISAWEVRKLAEKYSTVPLIGPEATFPAFCDLAKESRHFIFSGHSFFRGDCPEESGIIFSEGKILTIGNLLRDRLLPKCELVFVNGCESALLLPSSFDDHASLPTAFLQSGARCVISTLWPVDDLAAALFSVKFHELWDGGHGLCPAAALRESRLWLRGIGQGAPSSTQVLREHILPQIIGSSNDEATSASCAKSLKRLERGSPDSPPFADPIYWAVFTIHGVSWESFAD